MAEAQLEQQVTSEEQEREGHIVVAAGSGEEHNLQRVVTQKLTDIGNTYRVISDDATPHQIVNQAAEDEASALACLLQNVADRHFVYKLMTVCRRQQFYIPVILLGEAADPQYAQILALPEHGDLYRGGVYYCEDADEMEQVLKQIILYTPPPVEHDHDHYDDSSCSDCASCADNCGFNQDW